VSRDTTHPCQARGVAFRELAPKFDKTINSVRTSFYNPALAANASPCVQI